MEKAELTRGERDLLQWFVSGGGIGQYGECYGATLNALIEKRFVMVWSAESGTQNEFISKGSDMMYRKVSITDEGRAALNRTTDRNG